AVALAVAGSATPTWAAGASAPTARSGADLALRTGSGQSVVDWNQELLGILKTPGAQPAAVHPTRSYAIVDAAIYDAVVSITHADRPYPFEVNADHGARPDAAADQAAHDALAALYPSQQSTLDQMLGQQLAAL